MSDNSISSSVKNNRIKREYSAYTGGGCVHIRVLEFLDGAAVVDDVQSYDLADDGETVLHNGKNWRKYAVDRFKSLNKSRFTHEFRELANKI